MSTLQNIARRGIVGLRLSRRDGRRVCITRAECGWLWASIIDASGTQSSRETLYFDTGNFMGSRCPDPRDLMWRTVEK